MNCPNDGESEEIKLLEEENVRLRKIWRSLVDQKFLLETKVIVPSAVSFKQIEDCQDLIPEVNVEVLERIDYDIMSQVFRLCGIRFMAEEDETGSDEGDLRYKRSYNLELTFSENCNFHTGYAIEIRRCGDGNFELGNYILPYGLDAKKIMGEEKLFPGYDAVLLYLDILHFCGLALYDRKRQEEKFISYCGENYVDVDVFTTYDMSYIEIVVPSNVIMDTNENERIIFAIKYNVDSHRPGTVSYDMDNANDQHNDYLKKCVFEFMTFQLTDAFSNIIDNKNLKSEVAHKDSVYSKETLIHQSSVAEQKQRLTFKSNLTTDILADNAENDISEKKGATLEFEQQQETGNKMITNDKIRANTSNQILVDSSHKPPTPAHTDTNSNRLVTIPEEVELVCDLVNNDLSSIIPFDTVTSQVHAQRGKNASRLVSSTPIHNRTKSTVKNQISRAQRNPIKYLPIRKTYQPHKKDFKITDKHWPSKNLSRLCRKKRRLTSEGAFV